MKYLYIGIALLVVSLTAGIVCMCALNRCVDQTAAQLEQAIYAYDQGDEAGAVALSARAEDKWTRYEHFFSSVLDHQETDTINWNLASIRSYASTGSMHEFRAGCEQAIAMIRHLAEMETPYYFNIL